MCRQPQTHTKFINVPQVPQYLGHLWLGDSWFLRTYPYPCNPPLTEQKYFVKKVFNFKAMWPGYSMTWRVHWDSNDGWGKTTVCQAEWQTKQKKAYAYAPSRIMKEHKQAVSHLCLRFPGYKKKWRFKAPFPSMDHEPTEGSVKFWVSQDEDGLIIIPSNYILVLSPSLSL